MSSFLTPADLTERLLSNYEAVRVVKSSAGPLTRPLIGSSEDYEWWCRHRAHPFTVALRERALGSVLAIRANYPLPVGPVIRFLRQGTLRTLFASLGWIQDIEVGHSALDFQKTIQSPEPEAARKVLAPIAHTLVSIESLRGFSLPRFERESVEFAALFDWDEDQIHQCVELVISAVTTDLYGLQILRAVSGIIEHQPRPGKLPSFSLYLPVEVKLEVVEHEGHPHLLARTEILAQKAHLQGDEARACVRDARASLLFEEAGHLCLQWDELPSDAEGVHRGATQLVALAAPKAQGGVYR